MAEIRNTYFIRNDAKSNDGMALIFYSDNTYSIVDNVNVDSFKKFFENETPSKATAKAFDGSRKEVQDAVVKCLEGREKVEFANKDSVLYQRPEKEEEKNKAAVVNPTNEASSNWKNVVAGAAAVAAVGGAAYVLHQKNDDEKDKDSMEGKDWNYYLENAKESEQKNVMVKINNILERLNLSQNWMRMNDGTAKWGITPEQALSMYTYFNNLSTEELAQIYNGETVNVDQIMEEANQGMIAMSFFYANDTVGDTTIAELFNDEVSRKVITDFTEIQARYNRATNDKERTAIAKEKKQMYYDYFIDNSSSKYVDTSSVPGASFIINTMFPVDFVRYFRSSADLGEYDEILVTGRLREDGTVEHKSKVDSACGNLKADLEKYNEDIKELRLEYKAKGSNNFVKNETEFERLTTNTYNPQVILDMMSQNLKSIDKYPTNVNQFNSTIDGERRLIAVRGSSYSTGSSSHTGSYVTGGTVVAPQAPTVTVTESKEEYEASTPQEATQKAIAAGATPEMVESAAERDIRQSNAKEQRDATDKANNEYTGQNYYDEVYKGDKDKNEAREDLKNDLNSGKISNDDYNRGLESIDKAEHDKNEHDKAMEKDGEIFGGEITDKGSEVNKDGSMDIDLNGDGEKEHIPAHNPADQDNPYNMPDYAPGAFDVEKNNSDDEIVFDDPNAPTNADNTNNSGKVDNADAGTSASNENETFVYEGETVTFEPINGVPIEADKNDNTQVEDNNSTSREPIEQNPVSDEELGDMTFSGGAVSTGTSGGEVTDFNEDQLVDQIKDSINNQEVEIDSSIIESHSEEIPATGRAATYSVDLEDDAEEVISFDSFAKSFQDEAEAVENQEVVENQEAVAEETVDEPVKALR